MIRKGEYENGFIYGYVIDESLCDGLIDFYNSYPEGLHFNQEKPINNVVKTPGATQAGSDTNGIKLSTDVCIGPHNENPAVQKYLKEGLKPVVNAYREKFPEPWEACPIGFCPPEKMPDSQARVEKGWYDGEFKTGTFMNIQHYKPSEGYFAWHCERSYPSAQTVDRILVFMTYLNDVEDGGTNFQYQKITTPAKKGLTLVWPVDWTHTHQGQISHTTEKYIITGWLQYVRGLFPKSNTIPFFYDLPDPQ